MRSIMSVALTAVMLLSLLTGCGRKKNDVVTPAATNAPVVATERPAAVTPNAAMNDNATDQNGNNAVNDMVNGAEDAVNGVVNGVENAVNDVVDGVEEIPGDMEDGLVEDTDNIVRATPQAR